MPSLDKREPGLIERKLLGVKAGMAIVREEWDLTVPGCPMIAIDHSRWGTNESVLDLNVFGCVRTFKMPIEEWEAIDREG